MTLTATIQVLAAQNGLMVAGHAPVLPEDGLHRSIRSVLMLAPNEPSFWPQVSTEAEFEDGAPDPLDRWSRRVIGKLACDTGTKAYFPFGGGPRICIGNAFAMIEAKLVLATILQRFRPALAPGHAVEPEPLITLRPRYGVPMTLDRVR